MLIWNVNVVSELCITRIGTFMNAVSSEFHTTAKPEVSVSIDPNVVGPNNGVPEKDARIFN